MGDGQESIPNDGDVHHRRVPLLVVLAGTAVGVVAAMTGLAYYLVGSESTEERLERDRGEAVQKATQIQNAYIRYQAESDKWPATTSDTLKPGRDGAPYLEGGQAALYDPWGHQFQVELLSDASGKQQPVVWTKDPRGQRVDVPSK